MAQLLGVSTRAVQSFEQGWREVPGHIERHFLFLVALSSRRKRGGAPCWDVRRCSKEQRSRCPAWDLDAGDLCWFINGTVCRGKPQKTWELKMKFCRRCEVFAAMLSEPVAESTVGVKIPKPRGRPARRGRHTD